MNSFNKTKAAIFPMQTGLPEGFPFSQLDCDTYFSDNIIKFYNGILIKYSKLSV